MRQLIAGNWKMNGTLESARKLTKELIKALAASPPQADILLCPPSLHIGLVAGITMGSGIAVGAQDCSAQPQGAFTGDLAADQLSDMGCKYVILGHSERRHGHGESSESVKAKAISAHKTGLIAMICVGETDAERISGNADAVVKAQLLASMPEGATLQNTILAYEPVWAIGTGKTATSEDIQSMHKVIRESLAAQLAHGANMRILYGGSVKAENAKEILATHGVDGALVGGASLKAEQFLSIINAVK